METARGELLKVRQSAHNHYNMMPCKARTIIENAHVAIEKNMLNAIPWPEVIPPDVKESCQWHKTMRSLNHIPKRLDRSQSTTKVIRTINKLWHKAPQRTISLSRNWSSRKVSCTNQHSVLHPF